MKYYRILAILASLGACSTMAVAQTAYTTDGATLTQNFTFTAQSLGNYTWTDNSTIAGWYAYYQNTGTPTQYRSANFQSNTAGQAFYLFRATGTATDFALGSAAQATTGAVMYAWRITNTTNTTLTSFTLSFTGEQWYRSADGVNNTIATSYTIGSPANLNVADTFIDIPALTFNTPQAIGTGTGTSLVGNDAANRVVLSPTTVSNINWEPGTDLWIRWYDDDSPGTDHSIGIDDVIFSATSASAVPEPSTYAALAGAVGLIAAIGLRRRSKSAA